ncbi:chorismate synthase [Megalodesulfovibrio paquesii]
MSGDIFGRLFTLATFGESHGPALGGVVSGCPAGIPLSEEAIQQELDRRRPGGPQAGAAGTARKEPDRVELLSGIFEGRTTGTAIGFLIRNTDQRSADYSNIKDVFRPGHGDLSYAAKYGARDYRGGGRSSGRETACRVAGGAIALAFLETLGIQVAAYTMELGGIRALPPASLAAVGNVWDRPFFAPDEDVVPAWQARVAEVKARGDTIGGVVEVRAEPMPQGLGEPVFDKLDARLAGALMSIGAVKAVELGAGFEAARMTGTQHNDPILPRERRQQATNHAGGVLAGISDGRPLVARAWVKPIASHHKPQATINAAGQETTITVGGRHDIAAIPRIVPVCRAMAALALADFCCLQARNAGGLAASLRI